MKKLNLRDMSELVWTSPKGTYGGAGKEISEALGRDPQSADPKKLSTLGRELARRGQRLRWNRERRRAEIVNR